MFEFECYLDSLEIGKALRTVINRVKQDGYISKKDYLKIMAPQLETNPEDEMLGWKLEHVGCGFHQKFDPSRNAMLFILQDPIEIVRPNKMTNQGDIIEDGFDPVSRPSHYTEGREYEPRKVIADWGLNFNLGNAVKYIARAGKKGDKIEDLRKAIQYIEFEIGDCSKHSEYEEILNTFKHLRTDEQFKIIDQLKMILNGKYGVKKEEKNDE